MASVIAKKYDIILFGATGFTGQYVARELARIANNEKISWAIAGRNAEKMKQLLMSVQQVTNGSVNDVGVIIADVEDTDSLNQMAQKGKTVLNCVGPYRFYGEAVVRACVKNGTNHIDTSGEPAFLEKVQLKFTPKAQKNKCYIVGACGFDSIPTDMGTVYLEQLFDGQLNSVETFLKISSSRGGFQGNYATWQSAIYGFANAKELKPLRKKLFPNPFPELKPKLHYRGPVHRNEVVKSWCLPFPGSDRSVVMRTQRYFHDTENKRPVQMTAYVQTPSLWSTVLMAFSSLVFVTMAPFKAGQYLLERYPRLFSFGVFDHAGPSEEELKKTTFTLTLIGKGWSEKSSSINGGPTTPLNKELIVQVSGPDPGYFATAVCITQAALVLRDEIDKLPQGGGVFTPGAAFAKTSLIERLEKKGIHFRPVLRSRL